MFLSEQTYYDLLEVSPTASISDIKNAYLRMKSAYNKDSVATYSLVSQEDVDFLLKRLEEALEVLNSPEKRRRYDIECGFIPSNSEKVVSIDRVPPMDVSESSEDLLIAPATHFEAPSMNTMSHLTHEIENTSNFFNTPSPPTQVTPPPLDNKMHSVIDIANFQLELERETEWSGDFLRKTRETLGISIDDLASFSRVSKSYLVAIENDLFKKLPAPVFLRGFLIQICKKLKLPHDRVVSAYLDRYKTICPEKF